MLYFCTTLGGIRVHESGIGHMEEWFVWNTWLVNDDGSWIIEIHILGECTILEEDH